MNEQKLRLAVGRPMRGATRCELDAISGIMPSLEIHADLSILERLGMLMYGYQQTYKNKPAGFVLSPSQYLSFIAAFSNATKRVPRFYDEITYCEIPVRPIVGELEINRGNIAQIAWEQSKWSMRTFPLR